MYEEERDRLLQKIAELTEQNNRLIHKLVRAQQWATFWTMMWWILVIASALGAYYYLQPYLDQLLKLYYQVTSSLPANLPKF